MSVGLGSSANGVSSVVASSSSMILLNSFHQLRLPHEQQGQHELVGIVIIEEHTEFLEDQRVADDVRFVDDDHCVLRVAMIIGENFLKGFVEFGFAATTVHVAPQFSDDFFERFPWREDGIGNEGELGTALKHFVHQGINQERFAAAEAAGEHGGSFFLFNTIDKPH